jgi:hypothetical protein
MARYRSLASVTSVSIAAACRPLLSATKSTTVDGAMDTNTWTWARYLS